MSADNDNHVGRYNLSESSTAKSLQGSDAVSLVDGAYNGSVIKEDCSMATAGEPWNYPNQTGQ